ncbi:MAG: MFS transporter [Desulfovibrio sp.]|uniref:MFS transporter n=1 Tax=Desulfovibrio sp. 7SRBS1 TaxID=3378064 RepID=UPI003B40BE58
MKALSLSRLGSFGLESRIVLIATLVQFVNVMDFMMVMPLGPDISKALPVTNADIGLICGCYTLAVSFSGLVCSNFLDRFDRKHVALAAVAGLTISTILAPLAQGLWSLVFYRVLAGLFGGPAAAIALTITTDAVPPERRGRALAIVMGTFSIAAIVALPFGLELARVGGWMCPFYVISGAGLLVMGVILVYMPSMTDHKRAGKTRGSFIKLVRDKANYMALCMFGSSKCSSFLIITNISAFFQLNRGLPRAELSVLYFAAGVVSLVAVQIAGRLNDRVGPIALNIVTTAFLVAFIADGFMHLNVTPLLVIFVMFSALVCMRDVSAAAEGSKIPQPYERASFMALISSVQHFGNGVGALISSAILTTSADGALVGMAVVAGLSIVLALIQPIVLVKLAARY